MSKYTQLSIPEQLFFPEPLCMPFNPTPGMITFNSYLPGFVQIGEPIDNVRDFNRQKKDQTVPKPKKITIPSAIHRSDNEIDNVYCPECGAFLKKDGFNHSIVFHLPMGMTRVELDVKKQRYCCSNPDCNYRTTEDIPFQADYHKITPQMKVFAEDLLMQGYTLKEVASLTTLDKNVVKDLDKKRLEKKYTEVGEDGKRRLKPPTEYTKHLGIDEFLLHEGPVYATIIMDIDTGHVLYLAQTKKMSVVEDFMNWVGDDWMQHVEAVACDMNADFGRTFQNRYSEIKIVYDHFHIVKNFNDKVINEVRKDVYNDLVSQGKLDEARQLKGSKYILMSSRATLQEHDRTIGQVINPGSEIFAIPKVCRKGKLEERYDALLQANHLFLTMDLVKASIAEAYATTDTKEMKKLIGHTIGICFATKNPHFKWFGKLLKNHLVGILSHAEYQLSSGIVEGTNRKVKTIRAQAYGYRDDEYFFLKIIDATNN